MRILIGSNGGLTGVYLARQFKKKTGITLFGFDSAEMNAGHFFVDKQFSVHPASNAEFINELISILNDYNIDLYIPTHSKEIREVSKHYEELKNKTGTKFFVTPYDTFMEFDDKAIANRKLCDAGFPVPDIIEDYDTQYPIIMKKNSGSGSRGVIKIENERIHREYRESFEDVEFYKIIQGKEFTVDCMFDVDGSLAGINQRERIKTIGGAVSISKNSKEYDILPWVEKLANNWKFCGCVNFQYIVQDNTPFFIDINLRFPAGGLPLSVETGLDIPEMMLDMAAGKKLDKFIRSNDKENITMYRYFEEYFEK